MKRWARWTLKSLGLMVLVPALLVLAWVAFNNRWVDAAAQPVPERLQVAAATVPADRNIFFALIGIDEDEPMAAGQAYWAAQQHEGKDGRTHKPWDSRAPWGCGSKPDTCLEQWMAQPEALGAQLQADTARGERCAALAAAGQDFEELMPETTANFGTFNASLSPHVSAASRCTRWLLASAVVTAQRGQAADSLQRLKQADRLVRMQLLGSHTLVSHAVAWNAARLQWLTIATLVARHPAWAAEQADALAAVLQPLPEQALSAERWIAAESRSGRAAIASLSGDCTQSTPLEQASVTVRWWSCVMDKTYMPQATHHEADESWLRKLAQNDQNAKRAPHRPRFDDRDDGSAYRWRNTVGHILVQVGQASWNGYPKMQADVELLRQAAALAVLGAAVPAAERPTWLARQPIDADLRGRIQLGANGRQLLVHSWQDTADAPGVGVPLAPTAPLNPL